MKLCSPIRLTPRPVRCGGFTLIEMMTVVAIFTFIIMAIVMLQMFAARIYISAATKVSATTGGREVLNAIRDQIKSSKDVFVGTSDGTGFTRIPFGTAQTGNALWIDYANKAVTNIYYLDQSLPTTNILYSFILGSAAKTVMAMYVTNYYCFSAEDYQGNPLYNYQNNPVIHVVMQFYQWEYPIGVIGGTNLNSYSFYTLQTRVARRSKQ